ncbi:MAG TPA: EutN/CcmL family microcompartment protein [Candidatus Acidoferrales bacterium]|jgi:microcompartment protein CcmK/EutM|nr:EutN/CcmL family microcompartment protein [Candidatus Acidoferrales bacterium]
MILARIVGTVVATRKDARLEGKKLLVVKPISPQGDDEPGYLIAVDTVGSGSGETVLIVTGSSARNAAECKDRPVDAAIVGIVDEIMLDSLHEAQLAEAQKK